MAESTASPFPPLKVELDRMRKATLQGTVDDAQSLLTVLEAAREQIANETDLHSMARIMTNIQKPVKDNLESFTNNLKANTKAQRGFTRVLDKAMPQRDLPMETDAMANHRYLISRAVATHLLREGHFGAAETFVTELTSRGNRHQEGRHEPAMDGDGDADMEKGKDLFLDALEASNDDMQTDEKDGAVASDYSPEDLKGRFFLMYRILYEFKRNNILPAIEWCREHRDRLEERGSHLEFNLTKVQYLWIFKGAAVNGLPDDENNGPAGAHRYARDNFWRFQHRHRGEIQQLACALVYHANLAASPYRHLFELDNVFAELAIAFTREFCSLLGLAAESPLYVAVTAGAMALPRLIKYTTYMKEKKTAWTSLNELAFETPLPKTMIYHPIFVCPVSKEQTTEENPPMLLPCGHVLCQESLKKIAKSNRVKCPYCPEEGNIRDAIKITL